MMDPTATSSEQPPTAVLPVQSLEKTLRDLHVDIEVQSFIEQVLSQPARSTPTEVFREDARPATGSEHSVLLAKPNPRVVTLRLDTLSMAMEDLGIASSAVAVMKTAQMEELTSMPEPTPEGPQVLLARRSDSLVIFFSVLKVYIVPFSFLRSRCPTEQ
jgi:hypothetical protein